MPPYFPVKPKRRIWQGQVGAQSAPEFGRARRGVDGGAPRSAGGGCNISRCGSGVRLPPSDAGRCAAAGAAGSDIAPSSAAVAAVARSGPRIVRQIGRWIIAR